MNSFTVDLHLAQDIRSEFDELAIVAIDGSEIDRVHVAPAEDHEAYVTALAGAGWILSSPAAAREWTVTQASA